MCRVVEVSERRLVSLMGADGLVLGGRGLVSDGFGGVLVGRGGDGQVLFESCEGFFG